MNDPIFAVAEHPDITDLFDPANYTPNSHEWRRLLVARVVERYREQTTPAPAVMAHIVETAMRDCEPQSLHNYADTAVAVVYNHLGLKASHKSWTEYAAQKSKHFPVRAR